MSKLQLIALLSFLVIHLLFIFQFIIELISYGGSSFFGLTTLILGIITSVFNILFADKIVKGWLQVVFSICALVWLFPFFLITYFGIPMAAGFFILGIVVHLKGIKELRTK